MKHHLLRKVMAQFNPALALPSTAKDVDERIRMDHQLPINRSAFYNKQNHVQALPS